MNDLPKTIVRIDDGQELILDEKLKTYSFKMSQKDKLIGRFIFEFTYERLMEDPRSKGKFRVVE